VPPKVLIANRGVIARRILRTLRRLGIPGVAVYSEADRHAPHVEEAAEAVLLGPAPAAESYLDAAKILAAAKATGATAVHPGYGFLSENADFAARVEAAGLAFVGPTPAQVRDFGLKHVARALAEREGVPLLPGSGLLSGVDHAVAEARRIGFPVMLKSTAGGGGIGMRRCLDEAELVAAYDAVERLGRASFGQGGLFLEKLVLRARHVEVQIFGDGRGDVIALGERDCSLQRRNQKVVEETPAPGLPGQTRDLLAEAALRLGRAVRYRSAGTVEFVVDADSGAFTFLEVNTRIQVEHGVTEEVTGVDLIEWMVRLATGDLPDLEALHPRNEGASIQARIYAEDPQRGFQPSAGLLTEVAFPADVRVESWVARGTEVTPYYDPLLAKVIAKGPTRAEALARLRAALDETRLEGIETNLAYLRQVLRAPEFEAGRVSTSFLGGFTYAAPTIRVEEPGTETTVQDWPGRLGRWDVGVPPSGPMDDLAFRLGNRLVGNWPGAAALECTLVGPTLCFHGAAVVALTGADMGATLDGRPVARWQAVPVAAGSVLRLGAVQGPGSRAYLAVRGGLDVPAYLGSRATFTLGRFGGHGGRALRLGDVLHVARGDDVLHVAEGAGASAVAEAVAAPLPEGVVPTLAARWEIAVLHGPHGAPDFFTPDDIETFFATEWRVHYNSSRTGVRLIGPKPTWARRDGGEAGLHPSNIHDTAYAVGTVDYTGDMPVILGPDGPSLGGFVCPATIVLADLWKMGQLKAGDRVKFHAVSLEEARAMRAAQERVIEALRPAPGAPSPLPSPRERAEGERDPARGTLLSIPSPRPRGEGQGEGPILLSIQGEGPRGEGLVIRQDGDDNVLVEYGPMVLDLGLRFRVHALMQELQRRRLPGVVDLTPGIRSLQIHYDDARLPRERLLDAVVEAEAGLPPTGEIEVPSRIVHLPLSWDDPSTRLAIQKYMQSVRPDAPWCPSNIEFIRRINGLASVDEVHEIVFAASYLVLGLGDVYLGAPVATPVDPRHRLVTTKYNPARTWTPENAVGIGGAYLCVYGMEGPGGYQFVGRTCQMWNRFFSTPEFPGETRWLLRFFDQIRFYPVSEQELLDFRDAFPRGKARLDIEETTFRMADYRRLLDENRASIDAFKRGQQAAFEEERERWAALPPVVEPEAPAGDGAGAAERDVPAGATAVRAQVPGSVWQLLVALGDSVRAGDKIAVLETMKMETPVLAPVGGVVKMVACAKGELVLPGQVIVALAT
jgi:urea carboxylase